MKWSYTTPYSSKKQKTRRYTDMTKGKWSYTDEQEHPKLKLVTKEICAISQVTSLVVLHTHDTIFIMTEKSVKNNKRKGDIKMKVLRWFKNHPMTTFFIIFAIIVCNWIAVKRVFISLFSM